MLLKRAYKVIIQKILETLCTWPAVIYDSHDVRLMEKVASFTFQARTNVDHKLSQNRDLYHHKLTSTLEFACFNFIRNNVSSCIMSNGGHCLKDTNILSEIKPKSDTTSEIEVMRQVILILKQSRVSMSNVKWIQIIVCLFIQFVRPYNVRRDSNEEWFYRAKEKCHWNVVIILLLLYHPGTW